MAVHTNLLFAGVVTPAATWTTLYTPPAGKRTILKWLTVQNAAVGASDNLIGLWTGGAFVAPVWRFIAQPVSVFTQQELWSVIPVGFDLRAYSTLGTMYVHASGTELDIL